MVTFCARGVEALADQDCRLRLATLSAAQIEEVIDRLRRLNLDEDLIKKLEGQL